LSVVGVVCCQVEVSATSWLLVLISNFRRVLNVVCFLLGNSPVSEFYMPTRDLHVGRYRPQPVSVVGPATTLSPSLLLPQAIFEPFPI
jgi:hypothetical protein